MKTAKTGIKFWTLCFVFLTLVVVISYGLISYLGSRAIVKQAASLREIEEMPVPQKGQKVMIFSPHQDDESIGAGGYIATATKNGAEVKIVLVTDGNRRKIAKLRYQEFVKATGILGVKKENLIYLNYPDNGLIQVKDRGIIKKSFKDQIETFSPDFIIGPSSKDAHVDHSISGILLEQSAKEKNLPLYEYLVHFKKYPSTSGFSPKSYLIPPIGLASEENWKSQTLDVGAERIKSRAEAVYKSQLFAPDLQRIFMSFVRKNELFYKAN